MFEATFRTLEENLQKEPNQKPSRDCTQQHFKVLWQSDECIKNRQTYLSLYKYLDFLCIIKSKVKLSVEFLF